ncbi:MAG: 1,6-anhydro-N-acetylmuramyl-L-alanine amidase AmpD [Oleiphilaceae bacterium]|nr:1,6-anhydro-N-acetylmuramyl-L-alanine amidase AmpD [Oleiphilaceae bacterium]
MDQEGWLACARHCPSPNYGERPPGEVISLLVIHNISLPPGQYGGPEIEDFFCNRLDSQQHPYFQQIASMKVSAHGLIRRDGELVQFVSLLGRAWHAGRSCFEGRSECNDFSIGIELEGTDHEPYSEAQYRTLVTLTQTLMTLFPAICADRIVGHEHIAPGRKTDPGPGFDWQRYLKALCPMTRVATPPSIQGDC